MPHFIIEHTANFARDVDLQKLGELIRDEAVATGVFSLAGTRVRFHEADPYIVADGHPENRAMSVILRIGAGRDLADRQRAGQTIFDAICDFVEVKPGHDLISFEIVEIDPTVSYKKNTIASRLKAEGKA